MIARVIKCLDGMFFKTTTSVTTKTTRRYPLDVAHPREGFQVVTDTDPTHR